MNYLSTPTCSKCGNWHKPKDLQVCIEFLVGRVSALREVLENVRRDADDAVRRLVVPG